MSIARVNKNDDEGERGCGSGAVDLVDEALDSLIILYHGSLAANFGNLFAVTVLSPPFRRKSRGGRRTTRTKGRRGVGCTGTRFPSPCAPQRTEKKRNFVAPSLRGICS